jgi:ankyrin repeat protein
VINNDHQYLARVFGAPHRAAKEVWDAAMYETHDPSARRPLPAILRGNPPLASVAAFFGSSGALELFIDMGVDLSRVDRGGRSIAHFAAAGSFDCCQALGRLGVRFDATDLGGRLPAEYAAEMGRVDVLRWLEGRGDLGRLLPWSGEPEIVRDAARHGHVEALEFLVTELHAPLFTVGKLPGDTTTTHGRVRATRILTTALHLACAHGSARAVSLILGKMSAAPRTALTKLDGLGCSPLERAIESGSVGCVQVLIEAGVPLAGERKTGHHEVNPVFHAARFGRLEVVRYLVVNAQCSACQASVWEGNEETAVTVAAHFEFWDIASWLVRNCDLGGGELKRAAMLARISGIAPFLEEIAGRPKLGARLVNALLNGGIPRDVTAVVWLLMRFVDCAWFAECLQASDTSSRLLGFAVEAANRQLIDRAIAAGGVDGLDLRDRRCNDAGVCELTKALCQTNAPLSTRLISRLCLLRDLGLHVGARVAAVADRQMNWAGIPLGMVTAWRGAELLLALERGATLDEDQVSDALARGAFDELELRRLADFDGMRVIMLRTAMLRRDRALLAAAGQLRQGVAWLDRQVTAAPEGNAPVIPGNDSEAELAWAVAEGHHISNLQLFELDRVVAFARAFRTGDPGVLKDLATRDLVPTAEELGASDWFTTSRWRRGEGGFDASNAWINAVRDLQEDWSHSRLALRAIQAGGSPWAKANCEKRWGGVAQGRRAISTSRDHALASWR